MTGHGSLRLILLNNEIENDYRVRKMIPAR